jgi:hypothetical protein
MQDCDGQEKEHLRESQSTRINGRCLGRATVKAITNLNMKEMLTSLGTDESSSDSSMDVPGSSTYPDTVKNPSDTNDNAVATDNNEADVFVSIIWPTNDFP